jgi:hypothetical protein
MIALTRTSLPCADSHRSPALGISPAAVAVALEDVEALDGDATGALIFGNQDRPSGTVLVESGRICWATALSMRRRLTELLAHQSSPPLERRRVEDVYRYCTREKKPLGETLVVRGIVSERQLVRALRQHNAEALAVMSIERRTSPSFLPHKHRKYDARFTFSPVDLFVDIGALRAPEVAAACRGELRRYLHNGGMGAAFWVDQGDAVPIPLGAANTDPIGVGGVLALGRWAKDALDVTRVFQPDADLVMGSTNEGQSAVAWEDGHVVFAMLTESKADAAYVVARRARGRSAAASAKR